MACSTRCTTTANLSSTVLKRYQVVFDYPARTLTIAKPGTLAHRGVRAPAAVNPETGIVQIDAVIDGDSLSFALDMGASYSFVDADVVARHHRAASGLAAHAGRRRLREHVGLVASRRAERARRARARDRVGTRAARRRRRRRRSGRRSGRPAARGVVFARRRPVR